MFSPLLTAHILFPIGLPVAEDELFHVSGLHTLYTGSMLYMFPIKIAGLAES